MDDGATSSNEHNAENVELNGRIDVDISDALSERDKVRSEKCVEGLMIQF